MHTEEQECEEAVAQVGGVLEVLHGKIGGDLASQLADAAQVATMFARTSSDL